MTTISRLSVSLTADPKGFKKGMKGAQTQLGMFKKDIAQLGVATAAIAGIGAGVLLRDIVDVNAKFQTLKSTLTTLTGSQAAGQAAFDQIEKFAVNTPFNLDQVVQSFIKLKALGMDPSEAALTSYGNTASAMGKSLNQMIEAVADASTGEFERLKEFGIKAKSEGDNVTFTFQGIATTIGKNAEEIEGYLRGIGDNNFGGAMQDQMANLTPAFSNLEASVQKLQVAVGEAGLNDMIVQATTSLTEFINTIKPEQVVAAVGEIKGAFSDFSDFIDPITDFIGEKAAKNPLKDLMEGAVVGEGFREGLTDSARIAFDRALSEGKLLDGSTNSRLSEPTFEEFAKRIRGDDIIEESKKHTEILKQIADQQGVAVAG